MLNQCPLKYIVNTEQIEHGLGQHNMEWNTPGEGNCYEMGEDYPVWDNGKDTNQCNMGQIVWCMEAAGIFEN